MATTPSRGRPARVIALGTYQVTPRGNSKGVNCFRKLDSYEFPSDPGEKVTVEYREEGPDGSPEVVLKPASNDEQ